MDQQPLFNPAMGRPDTHAGEAGLPEARAAPTATVLSEGEWLAVSTESFSEQQRGRPLAHLVKKLVQNAMDSVGGSGRIDLDIHPIGPRRATVRCADDLTQLNIVFVTGKKDGVTQRGRMGRGLEELLSIATCARVRSRDQELMFMVGDGGTRRVVHRQGLDRHGGFGAVMEVEHDEAEEDLAGYFQSFLLLAGMTLTVNGTPVPARPVHREVEAGLTTERFAKGRWEKPALATRVRLVAVTHGCRPSLWLLSTPRRAMRGLTPRRWQARRQRA